MTALGVEYSDAVQNPDIAFFDRDLRNAVPETSPLGTPKAYSGGFAIVFRFRRKDGSSIAVRCFKRPADDLARRYELIAAGIRSARSPYFVDVEFCDQGIRVNGLVRPIVKMPWVEGDPLDEVLGRRRSAPLVRDLRGRFEAMVLALGQLGVAHGDLSPQNILVKRDGSLVLVDYDDMFVPAMRGWAGSPGAGHRNFQHPARLRAKFDERLDRFPAMVIWSALTVLEHHPEWWDRFHGDEEDLLFRASDFDQPDRSELLREITRDPRLAWIADQLGAVAQQDIDRLPSFSEFIERRLDRLRPVTAASASAESRPLAGLPLLDLRCNDPSQEVGSFVRVVGEIVGSKRGTTVRGEPYLFVGIGVRGSARLRLVFWSENLAKLPKAVRDVLEFGRGRLVRATGFITTYQGTAQLEIRDPRHIALLDPQEAARLLGSPWDGAPPKWPRLFDPRAGDRVHHDKFGFGLVLRALADVVIVDFGGTTREIAYEQYFLGLVDRITPPPAGEPVRRSDKGQPGRPVGTANGGSGRRSPGRRPTDGMVGSTKQSGSTPPSPPLDSPLSREDAGRLDTLYGGMAGGHARTAQPKTSSAEPPSPGISGAGRPASGTKEGAAPPGPSTAGAAPHSGATEHGGAVQNKAGGAGMPRADPATGPAAQPGAQELDRHTRVSTRAVVGALAPLAAAASVATGQLAGVLDWPRDHALAVASALLATGAFLLGRLWPRFRAN